MTSRRLGFARIPLATLLATLVGTAILVCSGSAHAQCTTDTECERDLICESGTCVEPPPAAPPTASEPPPAAPPSASEPPPAAPPSASEPPPVVTPVTTPPPPPAAPGVVFAPPPLVAVVPVAHPPERRPAKRLVRYSTTMMIVGDAGLMLGGASFAIGWLEFLGELLAGSACNFGNAGSVGSSCGNARGPSINYHLVSGIVLVGVGIPMIVIGSRKVPESKSKVTMSPWVGTQGAGLSLGVRL